MHFHDLIIAAFGRAGGSGWCHRGGGGKVTVGYTHVHGPSVPPGNGWCTGHPVIVERYNGLVGFREQLGLNLGAVPRVDKRITNDPLGWSCRSLGNHTRVVLPATILATWGTFDAFAQRVVQECRNLNIW